MNTLSEALTRAPWLRSPRAPSGRPLSRILGTLHLWQTRARQRAALGVLDDRLLEDVGLTRAQALDESRKPFWQR